MITSQAVRRAAMALLMCSLVAFSIAPGAAQTSKPIKSVNFQNADIRSVVNFLAEYSGQNIVAGPAVEGDVTLNLHDVTWEQALDILTKTYELKAVRENGYIRILPLLDYQKEENAREQHDSNNRRLVRLETRIIEINNASAGDLITPVKTILTDRGKVNIDKRTNSLIITDEPVTVDRIETFVGGLDRETRQIRISAKLLEVSSDYLEEFGFDWFMDGEGTGGDNNELSYQNNAKVVGADGRVTDPFGHYSFFTAQRGWNLEAAVDAIISEGKGKVVAHPEITTVDNKEARIQMGQRIPIKQWDASGNVIISFTEVGTILRVTPHITSANRILMNLRPERSTYEYDPNGVVISTNNAETNVVVQNGQTAVIGGLTTQDETITESGVPLLKDIPLLGELFKYKRKKLESRDLIIFVTPLIVDAEMMGSVETNP